MLMMVRADAQRITFFMVEQNASLTLQISHRGDVPQTGRVVLSGTASELPGGPPIRDAYARPAAKILAMDCRLHGASRG